MKNKSYLLSLLLGLLFVTYACSDDAPGLSVDLPEGEVVHLGAEIGADYKLSFHASQNWATSINANWLKVEPSSGDAGDYTLTLRVVKPNNSGDVRTATLTVTSGEEPLRITVTQDEYIRVSDPEFAMESRGGNIELRFYTPLQKDEIGVFTELSCDWLTSPPKTRAAGRVGLRVKARTIRRTGKCASCKGIVSGRAFRLCWWETDSWTRRLRTATMTK